MLKPRFRCSSLHNLMTDPKTKAAKEAGELSEGAKIHAVDVWTSAKYNRYEEVYSKFFEKGNEVEESSITFLSLQKGRMFYKNEEKLANDWIQGTPDLFLGKDIHRATEIIDIKSAWDIFTFNRNVAKKGASSAYYWQMQGYMMLTGASKATLSFCLVNATADLITDEKRKLSYAHRVMMDDTSEKFIKSCKSVERNMIYDLGAFLEAHPNYDLHHQVEEWTYDVPAEDRLFEVVIDRNEDDISKIKQKVESAWLFLSDWKQSGGLITE